MPYSIQDAPGDELAILESACDACVLAATRLTVKSFIQDIREVSAVDRTGSWLPEGMCRFKAMYAIALNLPAKNLELDGSAKGSVDTVHTLLNCADDAFFTTLPLLKAGDPVARFEMPEFSSTPASEINPESWIIVTQMGVFRFCCSPVHFRPYGGGANR